MFDSSVRRKNCGAMMKVVEKGRRGTLLESEFTARWPRECRGYEQSVLDNSSRVWGDVVDDGGHNRERTGVEIKEKQELHVAINC